jgi:hypothetical protein
MAVLCLGVNAGFMIDISKHQLSGYLEHRGIGFPGLDSCFVFQVILKEAVIECLC